MAGGRCGGPFPRPAPGAAEECPGSRRDVLNAERDGGLVPIDQNPHLRNTIVI